MGDPARGRLRSRRGPGRPGGRFLIAQARAVIACGFLVVETVLLRRLYVLVLIGHGTRRLHVAGVTAHPTGATWADALRGAGRFHPVSGGWKAGQGMG
jgi:hypothetical protein